jgi:PadR family transcriptional regulator PadR
MSDFFDNWTVQVRKGMLETYTLGALAQKERYGYELVKMLVEMPGLSVSEGTLYPILSRLKAQGLVTTRLVESAAGPARKYYALTAEGRKVLRLMEDYLAEMNAGERKLRQKGASL